MNNSASSADTRQTGNVLVVDASNMTRKGLTKLLARHGTVFSADGSETAWQLLEEKQPRCVVIDTDTLATLPAREYRAGLAEVIKYGLIGDADFFDWLLERRAALLRLDAFRRASVP